MAFTSRLSLAIWLFVAFTAFFSHAQFDQDAVQDPLHIDEPTNMPQDDGRPGLRSVLYYVNWAIYGRKHFPWEVPSRCLTHINYAFADVDASGNVHLTDPWADKDIHWPDQGDSWNDPGKNLYGILNQLYRIKKENRNLKLMLSIGGWTYSPHFVSPASSPGGRAAFAQTAVALLKNYGFDGLDIDWEYPENAQQAADYVALLQACRQELDAYSATLRDRPHFELTVASPAGPDKIAVLDLAGMDKYLDFWNLMGYDYAGSWDAVAGHSSNLFPVAGAPFSTKAALDLYAAGGVPSHKIVLGMPLYGRAFENTNGIGKPYSGIGQGSWEAGVYDFKALPLPGAREYYDPEAGGSYSYDEGRRMLVSYDTVEMAKQKAQYIVDNGLGGAMWWESSGDLPGPAGIIEGVVGVFGGRSQLRQDQNMIGYPDSEWDNLRPSL